LGVLKRLLFGFEFLAKVDLLSAYFCNSSSFLFLEELVEAERLSSSYLTIIYIFDMSVGAGALSTCSS